VEVRAERTDRIFLEGQKLITMVVSWEGNWGANVKSIVPLNVFSGCFFFFLISLIYFIFAHSGSSLLCYGFL